jgi:hypothetical protein
MKENPDKKLRIGRVARVMRRAAHEETMVERDGIDHYDHYDSPLESFDRHFSGVLAPYSGIRHYAEDIYGAKRGEAVAVEFGGPARALFANLNQDGMFKQTAGFVLNDLRSGEERMEDAQRHHDVVEADVFFKKGAHGLSWHTIDEWTKMHGKPDLIIERMVQGMHMVRRAELFVALAKRWLSQLEEGGTLLAEIPVLMDQEERNKIPALLDALSDRVSEIDYNKEMTAVLIRR